MTVHSDVACPFCGLLCDDLTVAVNGDTLTVQGKGCDLASRRYVEAGANPPSPRVDGHDVDLATAIERASALLQNAAAPLVSGMATDVNGARAALRLAERAGATVDHSASAGLLTNVHVVQTTGWITATFAEVRNRADLIVVVGERLFELFPRLAERVLLPSQSLLPDRLQKRRWVVVGPWRREALPAAFRDRAELIEVAQESLPELVGALRASVNDQALDATSIAGVAVEQLHALAADLKTASYSALLWAAGDLAAPQRDLAIDALVGIVRTLNQTTRAVGLPLAGSNGDMTLNQVAVWQAGYPIRLGFARSRPEFDAVLHDGAALLQNGDCDALLWVASLANDLAPPDCGAPTIVLGHPELRLPREPAVFIPVGIPGIDHAGHLYRGDSVVAIPLTALRQSAAPPVATVLGHICDRLPS